MTVSVCTDSKSTTWTYHISDVSHANKKALMEQKINIVVKIHKAFRMECYVVEDHLQ